jgi:hypothetical protein
MSFFSSVGPLVVSLMSTVGCVSLKNIQQQQQQQQQGLYSSSMQTTQ